MSSQARWRLLAIMIVSFVILGIIGWRSLPPPTPSPITIQVTPAVTTVTGSQTVVTPVRPTEWIKIGQVKPIGYYLSLLESNGTQPCIQLAKELTKLPDLTNATAVAKITYLVLNDSNSEVREALELMLKGGTPDPRDFAYSVPSWNTELQVLYWLACRNEFKKDDTLALAIAMVNGLWVTMGDEEVKEVLKNEANLFLNFFRDTNDFQSKMGWPPLEQYSLDAKILLVWTGDNALKVGHGPHTEVGAEAPHSIFEYTTRRVHLKAYRWNNVDTATLRRMQTVMLQRQWVASTIQSTYQKVEEYFLPSRSNPNWYYTATPDRRGQLVTVDGELVTPYVIHNARFLFEYFLETGMGFGVCDDQATLVSAFLKAVGTPTNYVYKLWSGTPFGDAGHTFNIYYEGNSRLWRANHWQLSTPGGTRMNITIDFYLFRPPVTQGGYLRYVKERFYGMPMGSAYYTTTNVPNLTIYNMFLQGVTSVQMKQWLLYS